MKRLWNILKKILIISLALSAAAYWADTRETGSTNNPISVIFPQATPEPLTYAASVWVYDTATDSPLYEVGSTADLSQLAPGEYYSFVLTIQNNTSEPMEFNEPYAIIDQTEPMHWSPFTLNANQSTTLHIYNSNMSVYGGKGVHHIAWMNGETMLKHETLTISDQSINGKSTYWNSKFSFPTQEQIDAHNAVSTIRSPYIAGWMQLPKNVKFTEYSVDFKADAAPDGTYCCIANWTMDLSELKRTHSNVHTEYNGVSAYAGFQNTTTEKDFVTIMSFWDIYATTPQGEDTTIRASVIYPSTDAEEAFGGEGTGAKCILPYPWKEGCWYRMLIQSSIDDTTGTTIVSQWVCDLATDEWTLMCQYDTHLPNSCFVGNVAYFLENYIPKHSGDIRTMELKNIRYKDASTGKWKDANKVIMLPNGGYPAYDGSYAYGSFDDRFWMITSGVGGDWYGNGIGQKQKAYTVNNTESGAPY